MKRLKAYLKTLDLTSQFNFHKKVRNLNKNLEEENEMVQDLEDVKELGKEMEQISEQNDEAFEEKKSEKES
ncbi:SAS053 family DNA gyrase inhibitor [Mammaliicoccus sciuri]|uniref:SAS053 family DNA gyrase inhibitor n=1 Tax=Mammaliicoccus sciuri TaxID=1296 RepID=UPI003F749F46